MRHIGRSIALAAGLAAAAGLAVAEERGRGPSGPAGSSSPGATGAGSAEALAESNCEHEMIGTVKKLDAAAGTVSVDVAGGTDMTLRLPPNELAGFEEGDQVVVSVGVRESRATTPGGRDPEPSPGAARTVP